MPICNSTKILFFAGVQTSAPAKTGFCPIFSFFSSVAYKMIACSYLIKIYLSESKYPSTFLLTIFIYICVLGAFSF